MTTKQKIKKWHIVVLIILGVGGYWLSQNMWVFEKQIPVEEYEEKIIGTWETKKDLVKFYKSSDFYGHGFKGINFLEPLELNWKIEGRYLLIQGLTYPGEIITPCIETDSFTNLTSCIFDKTNSKEYYERFKIISLTKTSLILSDEENLTYKVYKWIE